MDALFVVIDFDVFEQDVSGLLFGFECVMVDLFGFEGVEKAFHGGVVPAVSFT